MIQEDLIFKPDKVIEAAFPFLRGIRGQNNQRPSYATIEFLDESYKGAVPATARDLVFTISGSLSGGSTTIGRLTLKPYWFHKEIYAK